MEEPNSKMDELKINKKLPKKKSLKLIVKKVIFLIRYKKRRIKELQDLKKRTRKNSQNRFPSHDPLYFSIGNFISHIITIDQQFSLIYKN